MKCAGNGLAVTSCGWRNFGQGLYGGEAVRRLDLGLTVDVLYYACAMFEALKTAVAHFGRKSQHDSILLAIAHGHRLMTG